MKATKLCKENIEDVYPMSDIQKGIIYHSLKDSAGFVFINQVAAFFKDREFSPQLLDKAVALMVEKHPILRTGFDLYSFSEPIQIVFKTVNCDLKYYDLSTMQKNEKEKYINGLLGEEKKRSFNVIERPEPLWRIRIFVLDNETICFVFINHHAIFDGWSFACFITELNNIYLELKSNPGYKPVKLKSAYKEYVIKERLEKKKDAIEFWKKELIGFQRFELPRITGDGQENYETRFCFVDLGKEFLAQLRSTAKKHHTSVMNLCFLAYVFILSVFYQQNDIVVGLSINNRPSCEDGDKILGCFINHLPVRIVIPPGLKWCEGIDMIEKKLYDLRKYQKLSFFEIVKAVGERTQDRNPLFDTIFNFMDFHAYDDLKRNNVQQNNPNSTDADFSLDINEAFNTLFSFHISIYRGFWYSIQYYTSVFDEKIIKLLANCFKNILNKLIYEPDHIADADEVLLGMGRQDFLIDFSKAKSYLQRTEFNF